MPYPKTKYRKGYTIFGVGHLTTLLMNGSWVYRGDKVYHPSFLLNMRFKDIVDAEQSHLFREAIDRRKEWVNRTYQRPFPEGVTESKMW